MLLVNHFPKKSKFFGETIIPYTLEEVLRYCVQLDSYYFDKAPDKDVLAKAYDHFNYDIADHSNPVPDHVNEKAQLYNCIIHANAGAVFNIIDANSIRWYYCDSHSWLEITMK